MFVHSTSTPIIGIAFLEAISKTTQPLKTQHTQAKNPCSTSKSSAVFLSTLFFEHSHPVYSLTLVHKFGIRGPRGNVCPARAQRATFLLTILTSAPDLPSHEKPPKWTTLHCTPSLQSTLHNKAIAVNSTTPNVICIVLNKQHWSHKLPIVSQSMGF